MWMKPVSQLGLLKLILYGAFIGVVLAVVYDLFRIFRVAFDFNRNLYKSDGASADTALADGAKTVESDELHGNPKRRFTREHISYIVIFIQDILFSLICAAVISVTVFNINSGQPRWFIFLGVVSGFATYYFTVGKLIMKLSEAIVRLCRRLIGFLLSVTVIPIIRAFQLLFGYIYRRIRMQSMIRCSKRLTAETLSAAEAAFGFDSSDLFG